MATNAENAASQPVVEVAQGRLLGSRIDRLYAFRGVPYAIANRFGPPQPVPASTGIREAVRPGPICPQLPSRLEIIMGPPKQSRQMSEACQVLSIFSPDLNGKRPAMAWISLRRLCHGRWRGGLVRRFPTGRRRRHRHGYDQLSSRCLWLSLYRRLGGAECRSARSEDGLAMDSRKYRPVWPILRPSRCSGNRRVPHSVASLLATAERPLFRRAIVQSGPFGTVIGKADAQAVGRQFRTALRKSPASATVEEMLAAQKMVLASSERALVFAPVEVNPLRPIVAKGIKLDIVVTWTRDDAAPFVALRHKGKPFGGMIDAMTTIVARRSFVSGPSKTLATTLRKAGHQVSTYEITWRPRGSPYGTTHCVELPLLFGHYADWEGAPMLGTAPAEQVERFGREARGAAFAKSAQPPRTTDWLK